LIAALAVVVIEFADPATKARLYGWVPGGQTAATQQQTPPNP
jgi:hypothetical protein